MASTYISKARRAELIDEFMECWIETESYSSPETAGAESLAYRQAMHRMANPELVAHIRESGWGIL